MNKCSFLKCKKEERKTRKINKEIVELFWKSSFLELLSQRQEAHLLLVILFSQAEETISMRGKRSRKRLKFMEIILDAHLEVRGGGTALKRRSRQLRHLVR